jgi:hypothetical protein
MMGTRVPVVVMFFKPVTLEIFRSLWEMPFVRMFGLVCALKYYKARNEHYDAGEIEHLSLLIDE